MPAYLVIDISIAVPEAMSEYERNIMPIFASYGGEVLAFDESALVIEGSWHERQVVFVFPSKAHVEALFGSKEYAPWRERRLASSNGRSICIQGVEA